MQASNWGFDPASTEDDENDVTQRESLEDLPPEDLVNRFGTRMSLLVLCVGLLIAAVWFVSRPNFERCSALENVAERDVCYGALRNELLKPPAKGADLKIGQ
jgi:hypothetical protein